MDTNDNRESIHSTANQSNTDRVFDSANVRFQTDKATSNSSSLYNN